MQLDKQLKIAAAEAALIKAKVLYTKLNDGIQFMVAVGDKVWDYWPTTGTARSRDGASLDGLSELLAAAKMHEYQLIGKASNAPSPAPQADSVPPGPDFASLARALYEAESVGFHTSESYKGNSPIYQAVSKYQTLEDLQKATAAHTALMVAVRDHLMNQADEDTPPWSTT